MQPVFSVFTVLGTTILNVLLRGTQKGRKILHSFNTRSQSTDGSQWAWMANDKHQRTKAALEERAVESQCPTQHYRLHHLLRMLMLSTEQPRVS